MNRFLFLAWLIGTLVVGGSCVANERPSSCASVDSRNLDALIVKINHAAVEKDKLALADELPGVVSKYVASTICIDQNIVDQLIDLLESKEDVVRMNAAIALGNIGRPAKRAVPFLKMALSKAYPSPGQIGPEMGSRATIPKAIEKIEKGD